MVGLATSGFDKLLRTQDMIRHYYSHYVSLPLLHISLPPSHSPSLPPTLPPSLPLSLPTILHIEPQLEDVSPDVGERGRIRLGQVEVLLNHCPTEWLLPSE